MNIWKVNEIKESFKINEIKESFKINEIKESFKIDLWCYFWFEEELNDLEEIRFF